MVNKIIYTVLITFILISNSFAQDTLKSDIDYTLEEITVTSEKLDSKLIDISTKVEIITEKQIKAANGERLPEILESNSTTFIKSYGITPALSTISINGLGAEHTLIIVDGIKLNSFQNSHIDLSLIHKDFIDRIEIINNGVSSIYGSNALGGVVNIVTKNRESLSGERTTKYNASISAGSFNTNGYTLGFYKEFSNFNFRLNGSTQSSNGNFEYYFNNGSDKILKERENGAYNLYDIIFSTQYLFDKDNVVKILSTYSDQDKEVPGIETGTTPPQAKQTDQNWNNILSIDNKLTNNISLKSNFNFQNNMMRYSIGEFLNSKYKNIVFSGGSELRIKGENWGITPGYNFIHAELESNDLIDGIKREQHALFASTFFSPTKWLKFYPSFRYDYISDISAGPLTYKFGINAQPIRGTGFSIKGNIGKNFRAPSFNDLYWKNSGNKNLKPENSYNIEGGLFYSFHNIINAQLELSYTHIEAENKIVWTPGLNGFWIPKNIAKSVSNNFSLSFTAVKDLSEDFSLNLNTGFQLVNTKKTSESYKNDPTTNKFIPYIPLQSANVNVGAAYRFVQINLFFSFSGERYSDYSNENEMKKFSTVDGNINLNFRLFDVDAKLRFEANNIFNSEYEIISGYPMPLRYYNIKLIINY